MYKKFRGSVPFQSLLCDAKKDRFLLSFSPFFHLISDGVSPSPLVYVLLLFKSVFVFFKVRLCLMAKRPGLKRAPFSKKWCNWFSIPYQVLPRLSLETWEGKKNGRRMFCDLSFLADEFSRSPQAPKTSMQNRYKVSSHPLTKMCWKMHRCSLVNQYQVGSSQQQSNLFKAKQQGQKKAEIT